MTPANPDDLTRPSAEQDDSSQPETQREEVKSQEAAHPTVEQNRSYQSDASSSEKSQELQISLTIRTDTTDVSLTLTGDTKQPNVVVDTSVHKVQESSQAALPAAQQHGSEQDKLQESSPATAQQDGSGKKKSQDSKPPSGEQDRNVEQNDDDSEKSPEESSPATAQQDGSGKKKSQKSKPPSAKQDRNVEQNGDDSEKSPEEPASSNKEQNGDDSPSPQVNRKELYKRAVQEAFVKLNPKHQVKNPVMFFVWVGTIITALLTFDPNLFGPVKGENLKLFNGLITIILFFTVLFSNFAEAVAEGRGKSQADALRATKTETTARKIMPNGETQEVPSTELKKDDRVKVVAGDTIPADGEVVEGTASVDESAVTGESAPVTKEPGSDVASSVTGGTTIVSDELTIRVTSDPGQGFVDKMINLVEGADRSKTPNEIALTVLLAILTLVFLCVITTIPLFALYAKTQVSVAILVSLLVALIPTTIGGLLNAIGIAGMDRVAQFNVIATSGRAVEACGDINTLILDKTGTITKGNRLADEFIPINGHSKEDLAKVALAASVFDQTPEGKSIVELAQKSGATVDFDRDAAEAIEFSAKTKMSGTRLPNGGEARKGAVKAVKNFAQSGNEQDNSELDDAHKQVSEQGGTPLAVCQDKEIYGVINLKDIIKPGIRDRFEQLRQMGVRTVMLTGDNQLTAAAIAKEAGVDDFIAEAKPEDKIEVIKKEKEQGKVVAMTGDGTNDAPALAQADVGLAMNSGTQAAKEAANMVDLDSDPTKLIEIVAIGKQLLITRGALTTFSLANDISKYFAIIPAMFPSAGIDTLNIMGLASVKSAVLSALIYNALIIPALIPLALKGVKFRPLKANDLLKRNLLIYGLGGVIAPFVAIKLISIAIEAGGLK